jgi:YVTN family beta-propeller protein
MFSIFYRHHPGFTPRAATARSRRSRTRRAGLWAALGVLALLPTASPTAPANPTLVAEANIPLAEVSGRLDHMAVDLGRQHLFVAELGNNSVDVIDLGTQKVVQRIGGLHQPQGIGYAAGPDVIAVASAGDGTVQFFSGKDFSAQGSLQLGADADDVRIDQQTGKVVVGYGNGGLAIIDPAKKVMTADIPLPDHPEGFELAADRLYVNLPGVRQIAVVDLGTNKVVATWPMPLGGNFPMAMDAAGKAVATVFRSASRLVLFDTGTGKRLGQAETCGDADDVFFDGKRRRIYVSCGDSVVDVFAQTGAGLTHLDQVASAAGARTSLFVPELDRLFVADPAGAAGAAIQVYRPN